MKIRCLVTAGPTREYFDPVRFISNPSSGKMGFAIAEAAKNAGWDVDLVAGPVALKTPEGCNRYDVVTGDQMFQKVSELFPSCSILIMSAAVCDFRPKDYLSQKLKKEDKGNLSVTFVRTRDILREMSTRKTPKQMIVGFAAETNDITEYAKKKLEEKDLHWIVANEVGTFGSGFESDENRAILFKKDGKAFSFGLESKATLAQKIIALLKEDYLLPENKFI